MSPDATTNSGRAGAIVLATAGDLLWSPLAGRPLVAWAVRASNNAPGIVNMVLIVAPEYEGAAQRLAQIEGWTTVRVISASGRRRDAVLAGLGALPPELSPIVILDGLRPLVTPNLITAGLAAAERTGGAAATAAVNETIKRVRDGIITGAVPREDLVSLQSPQIFSRASLLAAFQQVDPALDPPDEATMALLAGISVVGYPGSPENLRVTSPADLRVAEALLR
jgi:2-C-methyl-D-erythritol 4-phosphate cytidylyltransferase